MIDPTVVKAGDALRIIPETVEGRWPEGLINSLRRKEWKVRVGKVEPFNNRTIPWRIWFGIDGESHTGYKDWWTDPKRFDYYDAGVRFVVTRIGE